MEQTDSTDVKHLKKYTEYFTNLQTPEKEGFLARDVIYTSRAYARMSVSVCLPVCLSICLWRKCIGAL